MKIALIIDHDIELVNGASYKSKQFFNWIRCHGHEVLLVFPSVNRVNPHRYRDGVTVVSIPSFPVPKYKEYCVPIPPLAISLWLKKWKVDLFHVETINPTTLLLAYFMAKRSKAPIFNVLTAHVPMYANILYPKENIVKKLSFRLAKRMMNFTSNRINGTFVLSNGMKKILTDDFFHFKQDKVFKLRRPLDFNRFKGTSIGSDLFDPFHVKKGNRLVTLSRLADIKNIDFLIRSFAKHIYPQNKELHFFIGGHGPERENLENLAKSLACPNIHFLGKIEPDAVPGFLQESDYFLYSSLSETFGNVVCEAKYSKLPVIALNDDGGITDQILNEKTGMLVYHHDEKEFSDQFFNVFNNEKLRESIQLNAHNDVTQNHDPEIIYSNLIKRYQDFIKDARCLQ